MKPSVINKVPRSANRGNNTSPTESKSLDARSDKTELDLVFAGAGQKLREGRSSEAEKILREAIARHPNKKDDLANLKRLLSFTLETVGSYKESLDEIKEYENEANLQGLSLETQIRLVTQLAIAYNNTGEHPKAVTLLKETQLKAKENNFTHLLGSIEVGLARVYRKLNECPICRDHAERALADHRATGDWLGMAEAYREIALSYHQEGDSEKSLEYFDLGIKIIGDRSAPFMLGKLYTDMSGAYWFLRKPAEGIECLERSITFFDKTEHLLNTVIAYNNLGIHLLHIGNWSRAEEMIRRALDLAERLDHVHVAGILDSLGELMILRGELDQAKELLEQAVAIAREKKREWYEAQAMRNLARCMLAEGRFEDAKTIARTTIELSGRIGDKHYAKMSRIVLADALLATDSLDECVEVLDSLESEEAESEDFFVFGSIQRIRGLRAIRSGDLETGIHHLNRCLTIFETASDTYNTAIAHFLLGQHLPSENADRALKHIRRAKEIFQKLSLQKLVAETEECASKRAIAKTSSADPIRNSAVSQMISARLAEATASRELLLRELAAVLEQESRIERLLIVEVQGTHLVPFIAKGFAPEESDKFLSKFFEAEKTGAEKKLIRGRDLALFRLSPQAAGPLLLFAGPVNNVVLIDGGPITPLLRIVELGLDVIALREDGRTKPLETFSTSSAANGMLPGFIHSSPAMTSLVEEIYKIRSSDVTVLVTGESGTGKELVSRAIHSLSNRKDKVFVPFNCTAVPKELAEGHLFGYKKGAFTGAVTDSPGMIRAADGGTLFLDEVGDLPLDVQPKLLRFLQEGEVQPVGEKRPIKVDVRVIAATNMPLEEKVADGSFREDLYYRLNVIRLRVPPLRERRSEIPPMVNYYVKHYSDKFGKRDINITPQTIDLLMVCDWEGNVRQLCNELQRIIARASDGDTITPEYLSPELKRSTRPITPFGSEPGSIGNYRQQTAIRPFVNIPKGGTLEDAVTELEMQMIRDSLSRHNWNISRVANELGLTRRGLYLKLSRYGIDKAA